VALPSSTDE